MTTEAVGVLESINPATEEILGRFPEFTGSQVGDALTEAHSAFHGWRELDFAERAVPAKRAARYLRANKDRFAGLMTEEMGKPIVESEAEIEKCAWNFEFYAAEAANFLADRHITTNATESFVAFEPLGVVLAVMPWNFPFWQVMRFAAPCLMAGNGAVLKHASNVPRCALAVEEVFRESGFPEGLFRTLLVSSSAVAALVEDPRIAAVTLTGSDIAGSKVAATAGRALKKCVMELGGSDAFIVLADAAIPEAVDFATRSRFQNGGQSCISAKRFIVVDQVAEEFETRFADAARALKVGDPMERDTKVGPLARKDLVADLTRQVHETVAAGARVLCGGAAISGRGYFYEPTVLAGVTSDMPAFTEETFGPAAAVIRASDEEHAISLANDSKYGLGGNLWTGDTERGKALARRIESGGVFINGMTASDPRLPFGGVKHSGYGRELSSWGIQEFTNVQTIWVGPAVGPQMTVPSE